MDKGLLERSEAEAACDEDNLSLAVIRTAEELQAVQELVGSDGKKVQH